MRKAEISRQEKIIRSMRLNQRWCEKGRENLILIPGGAFTEEIMLYGSRILEIEYAAQKKQAIEINKIIWGMCEVKNETNSRRLALTKAEKTGKSNNK